MDEVGKLVLSIKRLTDGAKQSQIRFAECISVDWDNRTMDARGTGDGVDYLGVKLGFGYVDIKPVTGSLCLIGIIEGQEVFSFLIDAESVELAEISAKEVVYNGGKNSGLVKAGELTNKITTLEKDLNMLKQIFLSWIPVPQDGAASLKAAASGWTGQRIKVTEQSEIEDTKVKH
jgi:hypothetical protein